MSDAAYSALRNNVAFFPLAERGNLRVTGEDRVRLLHAMCTNHIERLLPGTGCYAFFLTAQGRIVSDANVFAMPDYLLIDTEPEVKDRLREHLDKYIIADDAIVEDFTDSTFAFAIEGPSAARAIEALGMPAAHLHHAIAEWEKCLVAHVSYTGLPGYRLLLPCEEEALIRPLLEASGIPGVTLEDAEAVRIEKGRPRYGVDFSDANIPHETQLMDALNFQKGCYLGQEIVERVRSRGQVNRLLSRLEIDRSDAPPHGSRVIAEGKDVGEISSAAYSPHFGKTLALGFVRSDSVAKALEVESTPARVLRADS